MKSYRKKANTYDGINKITSSINKDIDIIVKIKNDFGSGVFSLDQIRDYVDFKNEVAAWVVRRTLPCNVQRESSVAYFDKIGYNKYRLLENPVLQKQSVLEVASVNKCREVFAEHGINLIIPTENNREKTMTKPRPIKPTVDESLNVAMVRFNAHVEDKSPLVAEFEHNFKKATNVEKTELACLLNPFLSKAETLIKFNQLYPVYAMPNIKKGDMVFHPIAGKKEVVDADEKWIYFYGNGSKWKCDRNGYIDGLTDKPRSVWESFESYAKDMNK